LLKGAEQQQKEFEGKVTAVVKRILDDSGLPTRKDFQTLTSKLDGIEKAIGTTKKEKRGTKA
jgi:polyhydroxyalkanoate synthesis regulator phasin